MLEYRLIAVDCRAAALTAPDEISKARWLGLAEHWQRKADYHIGRRETRHKNHGLSRRHFISTV